MLTLRATKALARHLDVTLDAHPPPSTGALGDWYCHLVSTSVGPVVALMSGPTRLGILSPAQTPDALVHDLCSHLRRLLAAMGVSGNAIDRETLQMSAVSFGKTNDRRLVGSLGQICLMVRYEDADGELALPGAITKLEDRLAAFVHMNLKGYPKDAVLRLLKGPRGQQ